MVIVQVASGSPFVFGGRMPRVGSEPRSQSSSGEVSQLLVAWGEGDKSALDKLIPQVYQELRSLAHRQMRREHPGHPLQTTGLVSEAYLRLVQQRHGGWQHRSQFFAVAARLMRRILVDHARRHRYQKRGGGAVPIDIEDVAVVSPSRSDEIVALDEALQRLAQHDQRKTTVVELRYFGGMTIEEIAEHLSVSPITVKRDWAFAKAWLTREMTGRRDG